MSKPGFLAIPATASGSCSINSGSSPMQLNTPSSTSTRASNGTHSAGPHSHHGLRSHLGHLLPRHALFNVHLFIDQLSNVPLVKGEFAVRWKFKNVQSGSGLLAKMKNGNGGGMMSATASSLNLTGRKGKGKGKARDMSPQIEVTPHYDNDNEVGYAHRGEEQEGEYRTSNESDEPTTAKWTSHPNGYHSSDSSSNFYGQYLSPSPPSTPLDSSLGTPLPPPPSATPTITKATYAHLAEASHFHPEARKTTSWVKLQNYNVKWDHKVSVVVQMDVHRETGDLLPNELKLVVMQRVIAGDPDAPQNPRLGAVYLNLAEYANAGPITRRYLLRESKTNATLKLTIELEHIGGTTQYKPPPLRKGEIMAEVSGLLSNNELIRTRLARNLDIYSRETSSSGLEEPTHTPRSNSFPYPYSHDDGQVDFEKLAFVNGLRTTEGLIDSIFNPLPTASDVPSPFTYYSPEKARELELAYGYGADTDSSSKHSSTGQRSEGSISMESSFTRESGGKSYADSEHSSNTGQEPSTPLDAQKQHWWQKIRSRPGTPVSKQFRSSTPKLDDFTKIAAF